MSNLINDTILERISEEVLEMDILDVAKELGINTNFATSAAWDSADEFLACADLDSLRDRLTMKRFESLPEAC